MSTLRATLRSFFLVFVLGLAGPIAVPAAFAQPAGAPTAPSASKPDVFHGTTSNSGNAGSSSSTRNTPTQGETTGAANSGVDRQPDTKDTTRPQIGERPR